eukprot:scaffold145336_cov112-Phaeocystis_antarctica.AAC.1
MSTLSTLKSLNWVDTLVPFPSKFDGGTYGSRGDMMSVRSSLITVALKPVAWQAAEAVSVALAAIRAAR